MRKSSSTTVIAAFATLITAADAAVIVTQLPDFGDNLEPTGTPGLSRYEVDIDGDGTYEVSFESFAGTQISAIANDHTRIQAYPQTPPDVGSWASPLVLGDVVGSDALYGAVWHNDILGTSGMRACTDFTCVGFWPTGTFVEIDPDTGLLTIFPESGYLAVEFTNDTG
ncbi:hypothetical protein OAG53_02720, partial [Akkermansiaceae bacterium]|nr:hypothetical protein [Akkermansiaceae bacterium]